MISFYGGCVIETNNEEKKKKKRKKQLGFLAVLSTKQPCYTN